MELLYGLDGLEKPQRIVPAAIAFGACDSERVGKDCKFILLFRVCIVTYCEEAVSREDYEVLALGFKSSDGL